METSRPTPASEGAYNFSLEDPEGELTGLHVALASADPDGRLTSLSPAWERITGWRVDESLGRRFLDFVATDDREACAEAEERMRRGTSDRGKGVTRVIHRGGGYRYVEMRSFALRRPDGALRGFGATIVDVTRAPNGDRDYATPGSSSAIRRTEVRSRTLFERAAFGIFRCSPDGRLVDVNPALAGMLGYPDSGVLIGRSLVGDLSADEDERARLGRDLDSERIREWYDLHWRRADGSVVRVRLAVTAERDSAGRLEYVQGIAENVTEQRRQEEIVRRGERMASLSRTLAGVAHEINNPLAAITGFSQILLKRNQPGDDRHVYETILREARRASHIVKDLLTISRREESAERTRVDLNDIVGYIVDTQRYAMETRGVRATVGLAAEDTHVVADAAQLEQVVLNLLVNARQALEKLTERSAGVDWGNGSVEPWKPAIELTTRVADGFVELHVADNARGIPSDQLPHIFDPFWTTRDEGEGSGLGLSVVHGIVTSYDGTIDVSSRVGEGSHFVVRLPVAPHDDARRPAGEDDADRTAAESVGRKLRPLDVLVVDDEAVIRELLHRYLTSRGHAVVLAVDGHHALQLAERATFDVVISDLRMPGIDGREVIRRLRQLDAYSSTRFILSTGDAAAPNTASDDGAADVRIVHKPYDVDALVRIVEHE